MHSIEEGFDPTTTLFHGWAVKDIQVNLLIDPMRGKIPYKPETLARRTKELVGHFEPTRREDIEVWLRCLPAGVPRAQLGGTTLRQIPGYVLFIDANRTTRIIPVDGSPPSHFATSGFIESGLKFPTNTKVNPLASENLSL